MSMSTPTDAGAFPLNTRATLKALYCQDILLEILEYIAPKRLDPETLPRHKLEKREAQRTLAALARVSRAFTHPALDVLWRVTNVLSLLSVLPPFYTSRDTKGPVWVLRREPSSKAWARFMGYAKRVKDLDNSLPERMNWDVEAPISPTVWTLLSKRAPRGGLLPRLQRLEMDVRSEDPGRIVLLSSSIRHLTINVYCPTSEGGEFEYRYHTTQRILDVAQRDTFPHLQSLRIKHLNLPGQPVMQLEDLPYANYTHLHVLEIEHQVKLDSSLLDALAAFPRLRRLGLAMSFDTSAEPELRSAFPALRELKLVATWSHISSFFKRTSPKHLEALTLAIVRDEPADRNAIAQVNQNIPPTLRRYSVSFDARCRVQHCKRILAGLMRRNLALTHLSIAIATLHTDVLPLKKQQLTEMASMWPNLLVLEVSIDAVHDNAEPTHEIADVLEIEHVVHFAQKHPKLLRLTLPFVWVPHNPDHWPKSGVLWHMVPQLDHGLQRFHVSLVDEGPLSAIRCVALLYDRLFPNLDLTDAERCRTRTEPSRKRFGYWGDVEQMIVALQMGRSGMHRSTGPAPPVQW